MSDTQASQALLSPFIHALERLEESFKQKWMQLHAHKLQIHARLKEEFESQWEHAMNGEDMTMVQQKLQCNLDRIINGIDGSSTITKNGIDLLLAAAAASTPIHQSDNGSGDQRNGDSSHNGDTSSSTTNHTRNASACDRTPTLPTATTNKLGKKKPKNSNTSNVHSLSQAQNSDTSNHAQGTSNTFHHKPTVTVPLSSSPTTQKRIDPHKQRLLQSLMNAPATKPPQPKPQPASQPLHSVCEPIHSCPYCSRMFYSRNGRATHIGMMHAKQHKAAKRRNKAIKQHPTKQRTSTRLAQQRTSSPSDPRSRSRSRGRNRRDSMMVSSDSDSDNDSDIAESDPSIVALEKKQQTQKQKKEKVDVIVIDSETDENNGNAMEVEVEEQEHQNDAQHASASDKEQTQDSDQATQSETVADLDLDALNKQVDEMDPDKLHCPICSKKFQKGQKARAKKHLIVHSDNRPYECHCGKTFKRSESVLYHQRQSNCKQTKKK